MTKIEKVKMILEKENVEVVKIIKATRESDASIQLKNNFDIQISSFGNYYSINEFNEKEQTITYLCGPTQNLSEIFIKIKELKKDNRI